MTDQRHNYEYEVDMTSRTAPANVVRMVGREKRVLEVGTGSGYQTAVLAPLVDELYSIERIKGLLDKARFPKLNAHLDLVQSRPAVQRVLHAEGITAV